MKRLIKADVEKINMNDFIFLMTDSYFAFDEVFNILDDEDFLYGHAFSYYCTYEGSSGGYYSNGFGGWLPDDSEYELDDSNLDKDDIKYEIKNLVEDNTPSREEIQKLCDLLKEGKYDEVNNIFNLEYEIDEYIEEIKRYDFDADKIIKGISTELINNPKFVDKLYDYVYEYLEEHAEVE